MPAVHEYRTIFGGFDAPWTLDDIRTRKVRKVIGLVYNIKR